MNNKTSSTMYSNRYNYNNNRAGPSRHQFPTSPSYSNDSFPQCYNNGYNEYTHRYQNPANYQQQQPFDVPSENCNRDRPVQNQKGPVSTINARKRRDNQNYHGFYNNRGRENRENRERQNFNNFRNLNNVQLMEDPTLQGTKKNRSPKKADSPQPFLSVNDYKSYICPGCSTNFDCFARYNYYTGKIPFILNCKHTLCQECIFKSITCNSLLCPVCKKPSALPPDTSIENLQNAFLPNYHLVGLILWSKTHANSNKFNHMLVSAEPASKKNLANISNAAEQENGEQCCFHSCNKAATLRCQECNDVYCKDCCTVVHKSAKSLWCHKQTALSKDGPVTLELEKCSEHNLDVVFFCKTCETGACCYCFLDQHEGHEKDNLSKLSESDMEELESIKAKAQAILRQLIISRRRIDDLSSFSTAKVEEKICNFFVNYHAKLQFVEKNLRKEVSNMESGEFARKDLEEITASLGKSIEKLKCVLATCDDMEHKTLNLKELLRTLRDAQNTPCYLVNQSSPGIEPIEFLVDPVAENIEDCFKLSRNIECQYKLVGEDDLPEDYRKDPVELQYESDADSCLSTMINSVKRQVSKATKKRLPNFQQSFGKPNIADIEEIEVTHIESLECFYVQMKKMQHRLIQMNKDIDNYIKMGAATVDQPHLNEMYLTLYVRNKERIWCRGRVTEFKNGETEPLYEVHFVDLGSTQTLDITKFREITPALAQRKSFAIECELQNPTYVNWGKNAHVYMGKMINGKRVFMSVKNINNGVHTVDLMVSTSDGGLTSIVDILINTCANPLDTSSDNDSQSVASPKYSYSTAIKIFSNSMKFEKAQVEQVIIANIVDPHHIFVHIAKHAESLMKLTEMLKCQYKHTPRYTCIPVEGTYVAVEYKDHIRGPWHRALVKKVDMNTEKAHVLLIDWGHNVSVPWSSIRVLKELFTKLESQAIMVKLAHVEPFDKANVWPEGATLFLQKYFRMKDVLKMIVHQVEPLEVALFEVLSNVDVCVNAQMVAESLADCTGAISQSVEWPRNVAVEKGFSDDDGLVDSLLKRVDEEDAASVESDEQDDGGAEGVAAAPLRSKISVVKFVDPSLIYIKFAMNEEKEMTLHKELQVHYSKERQTKEEWRVGDDCVVLYNLSYARAKILSDEGEGKYLVNVYDKPAEVVLPSMKIFEYSNYFSRFVSVVFKAHLANIRPAGGDTWSLSSIETLERLFDKYKDIYGTKVSGDNTGKSIPMHMWYTQIKMGGALEASKTRLISLNNRLVKLGYAYKIPPKEVSGNKKSIECSEANGEESPFTSVSEKLANASEAAAGDAEEDADGVSKGGSLSSSSSSSCGLAKKSPSNWSDIVEMDEKCGGIETTATKSYEGKGKGKGKKHAIDDEVVVEGDEGAGASPYRHRPTDIEDWIPAFRIKNEEFDAHVTCAEIGGILYLRDEGLNSVYEEMEENIRVYFEKLPPRVASNKEHDWQPGQMCTIAYDGYFYRGKVCQVDGPDDIQAIMIDFGSDHKLKAEQLYREIMFPRIPAFASKVKLHRVFPKSGAWLSSDYECLLNVITKHARIVIKGPLDVDVPEAEVFTRDGVNVNQALVQRCPNLTRLEGKQGSDESDDDGVVIEESVVEVGDDQEFDYDNDVDDDDEEDTTLMRYEHDPLPEHARTDKKAVMTVMAVLAHDKVVLKRPSQRLPPALLALNARIQRAVGRRPPLKRFEVGAACVCRYAEDGVWYRARVYSVEGVACKYVFVYFVDFGNVDSVSTEDCRTMRREWFALPTPCRIARLDVRLTNDAHCEHVLRHTRKLFGKDKMVRVLEQGEDDDLLVDIFNADGVDFYQPLIDSGILQAKEAAEN